MKNLCNFKALLHKIHTNYKRSKNNFTAANPCRRKDSKDRSGSHHLSFINCSVCVYLCVCVYIQFCCYLHFDVVCLQSSWTFCKLMHFIYQLTLGSAIQNIQMRSRNLFGQMRKCTRKCIFIWEVL